MGESGKRKPGLWSENEKYIMRFKVLISNAIDKENKVQ